MKILAFTDLHGNKKGMHSIINKFTKNNPELLICAGDLTDFGRNLDKICREFNKFDVPVFVTLGNHEIEKELILMSKKYKNIIYLHKIFYEYKNCLFFGFGGGGFGYRIPEFEAFVKKNKVKFKTKKQLIFVTHAPIYNTKLDILGENHVGCKSTRDFIEKFKPALVFCGHFHENENKTDYIGKIKIVNPGYEGMIIEA